MNSMHRGWHLHILYAEYELLPSGRRYRTPQCVLASWGGRQCAMARVLINTGCVGMSSMCNMCNICSVCNLCWHVLLMFYCCHLRCGGRYSVCALYLSQSHTYGDNRVNHIVLYPVILLYVFLYLRMMVFISKKELAPHPWLHVIAAMWRNFISKSPLKWTNSNYSVLTLTLYQTNSFTG